MNSPVSKDLDNTLAGGESFWCLLRLTYISFVRFFRI